MCHSVQEGFGCLRACLIHEVNHPGHGKIRECVLQMPPWPAMKQRRVSRFLQRGRFQHCRLSAGTISPSADCLGTPELSHCGTGLSYGSALLCWPRATHRHCQNFAGASVNLKMHLQTEQTFFSPEGFSIDKGTVALGPEGVNVCGSTAERS